VQPGQLIPSAARQYDALASRKKFQKKCGFSPFSHVLSHNIVPENACVEQRAYVGWPDHRGRLKNGGSFLYKERTNENESVQIN
jgi:hypothetical protein